MAPTPQLRPLHTARRRVRVAALTVVGLLAAAGCAGSPAPTAAPAVVTPVDDGTATGSTGSSASASPGAPTAPSGGGPALALTPAVTARLDAAITRVLAQAAVPGVIVGVSVPGSERYVKAFGVANQSDGTPMSTALNMRIGSETKTFTVTAVLRLVDAGRMQLDDPISAYVQGVPGGDGITLRQLAEMRSGLYSYSNDPDFQNALISNPDRQFSPQELLAYAFRHPSGFQPGTQFQYSNTNTVLLGLAVEKAGGRPLGDFLQQEVFSPAGLTHTVFPVDAAFPAPHAQGYTNQTANGETVDATDWNPSWAWAAGAMISQLDDMQTWADVLATGTLLSPATQAQRLRALPTGLPGTSYGLGLFINHGWIGHNGSLPGYQSLVLYLPSSQATLVVLANTDVPFQGSEPSTLFGRAITEIVSPGNVYSLPPAPPTGSPGSSANSSAAAAAAQASFRQASAAGRPTGRTGTPGPRRGSGVAGHGARGVRRRPCR
ncbi:serine hydrolase domain-containing protein [Kitasatospora sp. NPDC050543]|uniref:serine hydrolase domain-containing protein n=1 Tax=Kitasatospora sp. NPDC050543 TaxID=3364054 RepID=UPI0037BAD48A